MFPIVFGVVAVLAIVAWSPFFYNMFLAGRGGRRYRVSEDGAERWCGAALYVGKNQPTLPLVTLVVTPDSITAYAPFFSKAAYRRGSRGLADASLVACRVFTPQVQAIESLRVGRGAKITDVAGNTVYLYGRRVPDTLSLFGAAGGPPGGGDPGVDQPL